MSNLDIRNEIEKSGLKYWEVAYKLNINDGNFSRKLRKELPEAEKANIKMAIERLKKEKGR